MNQPIFVIYAASFTDKSGGGIALHLLAHRLGEIGEDARLWPSRPAILSQKRLRAKAWAVKYALLEKLRGFGTGPFDTLLAARRDLRDAIVVYPEVVTGNPLGATHVVRWLLNRPGYFTGKAEYGAQDLFFHYQAAFNDPALNPGDGNHLMLHWINPVYRDLGLARSGSCHLIRKGVGRAPIHEPSSIPVDDLSHEETAEVFNRTERFYCYDLYTFYANYAAICGCVPIMVPQPGLSKGQWIAAPEDRYGVAYGPDDEQWAIETRQLLIERLHEQRAREDEMLALFVAKCREKFA